MEPGKNLDGRTDLYALGASMYQMLLGRMPYDADTWVTWFDQAKAGPPVAPSKLRDDVPKRLSDLILELLAFRREDRPADADAVVRRLEDLRTPAPGDIWINPNDGLRYVYIPPGTFRMGCSPGDKDLRAMKSPLMRFAFRRAFGWVKPQ